jgi:hypothetical protein
MDSHFRDAFEFGDIQRNEFENLPVMFNFLERNIPLSEALEMPTITRVESSSEFNTTMLFLTHPPKPLSRLF